MTETRLTTNRYLQASAARAVGSRWRPAAIAFGPLAAGFVLLLLGVLFAALGVRPVGALYAFVLGFVAFAASPFVSWIYMLRGGRAVAAAAQAWLGGDVERARALCVPALDTSFRGDIRTKAFHVLGLCAEANGDFAEAADLFARAYEAIPLTAAPMRKRHARTLVQSHRALALLATGRVAEADAAAREAFSLIADGSMGVVDVLTDDATWGLGVVSMNATLAQLEPGRDPRAVVALAGAAVLLGRGDAHSAMAIVERERGALARGLLPRELQLLALLEQDGGARLAGGGPMRGAVVVRAANDSWAHRLLAGSAPEHQG